MTKKAKSKAPLFDEPEPLSWHALGDGYEFFPDASLRAALTPVDGGWHMAVVVNGQRYSGTRPTLEEAFKATDRLIYEKAKHFWLKLKGGAAIAPWANTIPTEETQ